MHFELRRAGKGLWQLWRTDGSWTDGIPRDRAEAERVLHAKRLDRAESERMLTRWRHRLPPYEDDPKEII